MNLENHISNLKLPGTDGGSGSSRCLKSGSAQILSPVLSAGERLQTSPTDTEQLSDITGR